jgi:hypothetical protein
MRAIPNVLMILCALSLQGCKEDNQPEERTELVSLGAEIDGHPEKVQWLLKEIESLKPDTDVGSWYRHLWPEPDESLVELAGNAGSLGDAHDAVGLGVGDEWILIVNYSYGYGRETRPIYGARIYRGSVARALANDPGDMEVVFPYYWKGEVIRDLVDEEKQADWPWLERQSKNVQQAGTGQPATRPESKSEGNDKPQPEAEERSR